MASEQPSASGWLPRCALAARANYLAADKPDVQFAAKEVCRWIQTPTELGVTALKKLARYLSGRPRLVYHYDWQQTHHIDVYCDTDWAGCKVSRKSTCGGVISLGNHILSMNYVLVIYV